MDNITTSVGNLDVEQEDYIALDMLVEKPTDLVYALATGDLAKATEILKLSAHFPHYILCNITEPRQGPAPGQGPGGTPTPAAPHFLFMQTRSLQLAVVE